MTDFTSEDLDKPEAFTDMKKELKDAQMLMMRSLKYMDSFPGIFASINETVKEAKNNIQDKLDPNYLRQLAKIAGRSSTYCISCKNGNLSHTSRRNEYCSIKKRSVGNNFTLAELSEVAKLEYMWLNWNI